MDTIVGKDKKSPCLTLTEELTKFTFLKKLKEKKSTEVLETLKQIFKNKLLKKHLKGIITDQGKEFWNWKDIEKHLKTNVYFCDPGKPKQKALVERINRDIRRELPKSTDFRIIKQDKIDWIINTINDKIRPCLNWETPTQLFNKYIK